MASGMKNRQLPKNYYRKTHCPGPLVVKDPAPRPPPLPLDIFWSAVHGTKTFRILRSTGRMCIHKQLLMRKGMRCQRTTIQHHQTLEQGDQPDSNTLTATP